MRRLLTVIAVLSVLAAIGIGGSTGFADNDTAGGYLALGDSVPFGFSPLIPPALRSNPNNFIGYPEAFASTHDVSLANLSCPGETSASMISTANPDNGCQRFRTRNKHLHTDYSGAQLAAAVAYLQSHPNTRLVSITIGHNDLVLMENACQMQVACELAALPALQTHLTANLRTILGTIRDTGYDGAIVAVTYYATDYENVVEMRLIRAVDSTLALVTKEFDGRVAGGFRAFRKAARTSDGNACLAGLLIVLPTSPLSCDFHPDQSGRELLAATLGRSAHFDD